MADYRQIHTHIWKDGWFITLSPADKLLFVYLFSNERASVCGMYEISPQVIVFETRLTKKQIETALARFEAAGKVYYRDGIVWIVNLRRYNENASPKVKVRIENDLAQIPDCELKKLYFEFHGMKYRVSKKTDRVSIPYLKSESEQEQEQEQEKAIGADAPPPPPKTITPQQDWVSAICEVTGWKSVAMGGRAGKLAQVLKQNGTPDDVRHYYGRNPNGTTWNWYRDDWRGKKGDLPGEAGIRETWFSWETKAPAAKPTFREVS